MATPVPLVVGVTGHRDLVPEDVPGIKRQIKKFIDELHSHYPDSPVLIMSGAAEGADTLVVEVAQSLNCQIQLVLPMPQDHYIADFDGSAKEKLETLISRHPVVELPILPGRRENKGSIDKDLQYQQLGNFLAAHSHILLALWNGQYNDAVGGTSQVVEFHQRDITSMGDAQQIRSSIDISDDESDLVYHIVCRRQSADEPEPVLRVGDAYWFSRNDEQPRTQEMPSRYHQVFSYVNRFNRDMVRIDEKAAISSLPSGQTQPRACRAIQDIYGVSDFLARKYQKRFLLALRTTMGSAVLAGLFFVLYADFEGHDYMIWGYLLSVGVAVASYYYARKNDWQRCYVDYRVLAEALRVQYYWALAGIRMSNPTRFSHDRFMQGRDLELGWVRNVMRYTGLPTDASFSPGPAELKDAIKGWVGDPVQGQLAYYQRQSARQMKRHKRTQWLVTCCFIAGLLAASLLTLDVEWEGMTASTWLVALMGILPIIAASRQTLAHRLEERELVAQYAHMKEIYAHADRLLKEAVRSKEGKTQMRTILRDLGEASLTENAHWVLRQRERPLPGGESIG